MDLLLTAAFMVGPIESFPANVSNTDGEDNISTMHWFGQFPEMFQPIRDLDKEIFLYARTLFKDPDSSHKVYLQKVAQGSAGHNHNSCYVVEYCDDIPWTPTGVIHVCTHEMVHAWLYLGDEPDGYQNFWFIEGHLRAALNYARSCADLDKGIANFYALYVPVRAGVKGVEYFRELLDNFLCAYYTSPLVATPLKDVGSGFHGQLIPYTRGVVYLLFMDAFLRLASTESLKDCNPIDEVVLSILDKYYKGDVTDVSLWLDTLYPRLGKEVVDGQFQSMMNGTVLQPDTLFTFPVGEKVIKLEAVDQEAMEVGFDSKSFETRIIEGLLPGSRAELAGLQNGDELVGNTDYSASKYNVEQTARVTVQREGVRIHVEYRPRSFAKVPSFRTALLE